MAITSEKLLEAAQLEPQDLGEKIVNPDGTDEQQLAQAIAWLNENVLSGAVSEVSVPFRAASGYGSVNAFIDGRFATLENGAKAELKAEGSALWDFAVKSYGRSEINKSIDSNAKEYDADSDQDRIQGNQRLQKLLDWASVLIETNGSGAGADDDLPGLNGLYSQSVKVVKKW